MESGDTLKNIQKGSSISAKHTKSGEVMTYRVVEERESGLFRLLNLETYYLMNGFKATSENKVIEYIEQILECEIISISN